MDNEIVVPEAANNVRLLEDEVTQDESEVEEEAPTCMSRYGSSICRPKYQSQMELIALDTRATILEDYD